MPVYRFISPATDRGIAPWLLGVVALLLAAGVSLGTASPAQAAQRLAQCANNLDDDGDGKIDFRAEPGCTSLADATEADPVAAPLCADGADNDSDGKIDFPLEAGCTSAADNNEANPALRVCSDGLDNDGDGVTKIDYPADLGCNFAADNSEVDRACSDGRDNDSDGKVDFPSDFGCATAKDATESDPPQCDDGRDNDGNGTLDFDTNIPTQTRDPGCDSAVDTVEAPGPPPPPPPPVVVPLAGGAPDATAPPVGTPQVVFGFPSSVRTRLLTPFPIVRLSGRIGPKGVRVTLFTVRAPTASKVSVYCSGTSCPRRRLAIRAGRRIVRVRQFERRLRGGTILEIYVTNPGFIGKYTRFRFMNNRAPMRVDRCATTPGTQLRTCPAS